MKVRGRQRCKNPHCWAREGQDDGKGTTNTTNHSRGVWECEGSESTAHHSNIKSTPAGWGCLHWRFGAGTMLRELSHMLQELQFKDEDLLLLQQKRKWSCNLSEYESFFFFNLTPGLRRCCLKKDGKPSVQTIIESLKTFWLLTPNSNQLQKISWRQRTPGIWTDTQPASTQHLQDTDNY